jgi:ferredoxin
VKVHIDSGRCQGHGRCYDLAPGLFGDDDEGYGQVLGDGIVPPGEEKAARLAVANCPERAIDLLEETGAGDRPGETRAGDLLEET